MTICARCHLEIVLFEPDPCFEWPSFWTNRDALGQRCTGKPLSGLPPYDLQESDVEFADHVPMEEAEEMAHIAKDVAAMLVELS